MDVRGMAGVKAGYAGTCSCGHSTFALQGDPDSVAKAMVEMEEVMEGRAKFGSQPGVKR